MWCDPPLPGETSETADQRIAREALPFFNGKWFRSTLCDWLRLDGFVPTRDEPTVDEPVLHYNVDLGTLEDRDDVAERFFRRFGEEVRNQSWPYKELRGSQPF